MSAGEKLSMVAPAWAAVIVALWILGRFLFGIYREFFPKRKKTRLHSDEPGRRGQSNPPKPILWRTGEQDGDDTKDL